MNRPSFFLVGAAKCGTTALYECLRQHPGIFIPQSDDPECNWLDKDPFQYCGDRGVREWLRLLDSDEYLKLFEEAPEDAICGTAAGWKLDSKEAPVLLKEFEPEAKIVMMLRPPVAWMRSWHHELLTHAYEDKVGFGEALLVEGDRRDGRSIPRRTAFAGCLQYREAARFSEQVERYYEVFGREHVFVGLLEDFESDASVFLKNLLDFLERDSSVELAVTHENDSKPLRGTHHFDLAMGRAMDRVPGGRGLKKVFARLLQDKYHKLTARIFAPMSDKKIGSILEEELLEEFEPEVAKLGKLLGRDLSHWNEPCFPRPEHGHDHHH